MWMFEEKKELINVLHFLHHNYSISKASSNTTIFGRNVDSKHPVISSLLPNWFVYMSLIFPSKILKMTLLFTMMNNKMVKAILWVFGNYFLGTKLPHSFPKGILLHIKQRPCANVSQLGHFRSRRSLKSIMRVGLNPPTSSLDFISETATPAFEKF